jgi:hypothetical protein
LETALRKDASDLKAFSLRVKAMVMLELIGVIIANDKRTVGMLPFQSYSKELPRASSLESTA